ncbi:MAG: GNAT family N-acetyltransferase [Actinomycetales bacterium]|nr:GNAT family N-acetyltransferase [Actinomycetales bacterium]
MSEAPSFAVRRVRAEEWPRIRALRLEALRDPAAALAFLETVEQAQARPDSDWIERAARNAAGEHNVQFVVERGENWLGSAVGFHQPPGQADYFGRSRAEPRALLVGVYVAPAARGDGAIEALAAAVSGWARERGHTALWLDVHEANARARAAYRRLGFVETGERITGEAGVEFEMRRDLG